MTLRAACIVVLRTNGDGMTDGGIGGCVEGEAGAGFSKCTRSCTAQFPSSIKVPMVAGSSGETFEL
jgi:hypothetical protein